MVSDVKKKSDKEGNEFGNVNIYPPQIQFNFNVIIKK